jgi:hypothetical protein
MVHQIADAALTRRRGRDQLLARIRQDGASGEWTAKDADGNPCTVANGANGLEIYRAGEAGDDQSVPGIIGAMPPGAAALDRLRRRMTAGTAHDTSQAQAGRMAAWQ